MKIKTKRKDRIDIADSGALSDLAFLLIIFFIVIAVFNINTGFILGLPRKDSSKIVNTNDIIKANLNEEGELFVDGDTITIEELKKEVKERLETRPNMTFLLKIHPETLYQKVVDVIDLVREANVENFSFTMVELEE